VEEGIRKIMLFLNTTCFLANLNVYFKGRLSAMLQKAAAVGRPLMPGL
jgi:hypothetical protein